ncbi:MAG: tetratricopeptide repeat protein [Deltaproteobacteria bacterium]|nr:tetratricopeptide repeat protein [Deltaproteobacteria bacterium]
MIHLLISVAAGAVIFCLLYFFHVLAWGWALPIALVVMMGVNYLLGRRLSKAIAELMEGVGRDLKTGKMDRAIRTLEGGLKYGRYQFFVTSQLKAQIGVIHYIKKDFNTAFPFLKKAFARHWIAQGMLAAIYMRRKDKERMIKTFQRAVRYNPKEGLLWNLYAFCLLRTGDRAEAIQVLIKGSKKHPSDEQIRKNLIHLQNNKKMKMKSYGEMWIQFHLEKMPGNLGRRPSYPVSRRRRMARR